MLIRDFKLDTVCDEAAKWWLAAKFGRVAVFGYYYPIEYQKASFSINVLWTFLRQGVKIMFCHWRNICLGVPEALSFSIGF